MARRYNSTTGTALITFSLCQCSIIIFLITVLAWALVAPALTAYLLMTDPEGFKLQRTELLVGSAAAPLLCLLFVRRASPRTGRLRGSRDRLDGEPARQGFMATAVGYLVRAGILLGVTTATAMVVLVRLDLATPNSIVSGQIGMREFLTLFGDPAIAAIVVLLGIRLWDRRPYPVTIETVRAAADLAHQTLRQVRDDNRRVSRFAEEVAAKLAAARSETHFVTLRTLHFESFGCADVAHVHYRSAQDSLGVMGRILGRVRAAPRRWRPPTNQAQADRARQDRAELKAAASTLAETSGQLTVEVERGLELVQALNANTSELKHSIGSDCGEPGRLWYDALEQRVETARRNDRRTSRAGRRA